MNLICWMGSLGQQPESPPPPHPRSHSVHIPAAPQASLPCPPPVKKPDLQNLEPGLSKPRGSLQQLTGSGRMGLPNEGSGKENPGCLGRGA